MSIQKIHDFYYLTCDNCGKEHEQEFGYFYEAVDAKKDGWRSRKVNGHWEDWCETCCEVHRRSPEPIREAEERR